MSREDLRYVATVEARMASSRLPGKILMDLAGKPSLERLVERARRSKYVAEVVVATTANASDDAVEAWGKKAGVPVWRGSEEDVLARVLDAATACKADVIVELTGDCPLVDPALIDEAVSHYIAHPEIDYVSNNKERSYARGFDVQVFSRAVLAEVDRLTRDAADHEHVSLYIYEHPERYKLATLRAPKELFAPDQRVCVDTEKDYTVVRSVFEALLPKKPHFDARDVMDYLNAHPEIAGLNAEVKQKPVRQ